MVTQNSPRFRASSAAFWLGVFALAFGVLGVAMFNLVLVSIFFALGLVAVAVGCTALILLRHPRDNRASRVGAMLGIGLPLGFLVLAPCCMSVAT